MDMATYQIQFSQRYSQIPFEEASTHMHFTKSTHNQKIDFLCWACHQANHLCNSLLFLFLWMPTFQKSIDHWVPIYNTSRKQKDKRTELPTGCSPNLSYSAPEHFGSNDKSLKVPQDDVAIILQNDYPHRSVMFAHTPDWFHELATRIMQEMDFSFDQVSLGGIWLVFDEMLPYITANIPLDYIPSQSMASHNPGSQPSAPHMSHPFVKNCIWFVNLYTHSLLYI
ncbi:hypothetical protein MJO28_008759 [Puccinia striiformis f. sp. tritici]|uniref:Uncharacterized protein n=1 Tax=Puccinia striiformis f. sp. tritici TaxID=168172 RepID=A0ACC0ECP3_9BASI|nr:hypothetical protein MJO28_008759 [Puccinia striiformis f. sp. tritici]